MKSLFQSAAIAGIFIAAGLILGGQRPNAIPQGSGEPATSERYLAHISTDKPIYRAGEKVYVRGVVLTANGHSPIVGTSGATRMATFEIKGPKGDIVVSGFSTIVDSVAGFQWDIPAAQAGGEYTVRLFSAYDAPAERKFDIRAYRAPRLKSQIVFVRDGYGPGEMVSANLHVERAEGGIPAGARVSVSVRVDGGEVWKGETAVDGSGNAGASFKLPAAMARGEGVIAMVIQDGGAVESATKTIPILLQTLDLAIYPEGGDLVAGLTNRVYVEGRTPAKKPADMAGVVVSATGREVASFRTQHEGRGRFSFVPVKGEKYSIRLTEPAGIKTVFPLPSIKESGVVLSSTADVIPRQSDAMLRVAATADGVYGLALTQYGKEFSFKRITLKANHSSDETLSLPRSLDGVIVATIFDEHDKPLAERLLFRQPEHNLKVKIVADREDYVPGDKVTLRVTTTDDKGKPVGAVVGLTVTDSSVLEMIEKRDQAPRLPVMVLLESDVRNLADAHVYLDESNPKAPLATDLLLGTQGWRRFAKPITGLPASVMTASYGFGHGVGEGKGAGLGPGNQAQDAVANARPLIMIAGTPAPMAAPAAPPPPPPPPAAARTGVLGGVLNANFAREGIAPNMSIVREYAHTLRPNWTEGSRVDFAETVYWNAGVRTDPSTGVATVSFNLSDSVTSFNVSGDGFTADGTLGSSTSDVESVQPFSIEPKIPLQVTSGDVIQLPIGLINGMSRELRDAQVSAGEVPGLKFGSIANSPFSLRGKERARRLMQIDVDRAFSGSAKLTLDARAGGYRDSVNRQLDVQPLGFPHESSTGGVLERDGSRTFSFTLPADFLQGSVSSTATVYPTPFASMTDALQSLLQQPNGCFEQTSSTSYPMTMAQQYFLTHTGVDPAIIEKAKGLLDVSYKKLTGFESRSKGYEWFGADPGHEALTAYGLMQFTDMAQVRNVDKEMLDRTRSWLLSRRDGNGGFSVNPKAVDSFGRAPADTTNAYIVWALIESGEKGLDKEIAKVKASAGSTPDSYVVALGANILHSTGDRAGARQLMEKLAKSQDAAGNVKGAVTSITRSGGDALSIETTALSVLAWMREPSYADNVEKGLKWIIESNKSGRFGSTQSTILALRSIVAYDAAHARPKAPGRIILTLDGKTVGTPLAFTADTKGALAMPEFTSGLGPGKHTVALRMEDGSSMPFSMNVKYYSVLPDSSEQTQVGIQVALKDRQVQEGGVTEAVVSITNKSDQVIPTPVAIVGIPGGLEVRHDHLKELVKAGKIDAYEVIGREVILYWRYLKSNDRFDLPLSLVAAVPGSYTGPASRAYLYYTDEYKNWAPGLKVNITPR